MNQDVHAMVFDRPSPEDVADDGGAAADIQYPAPAEILQLLRDPPQARIEEVGLRIPALIFARVVRGPAEFSFEQEMLLFTPPIEVHYFTHHDGVL